MNPDQQRIRLCKEMSIPSQLPKLESILEYVVTSKKDIENIEQERNQFKTVCGQSIQQGQISFQCFNCTLDAHHMYCGKCFIPDYHIGHKAIMRHNIGGCCDCGDNQTIPNPLSFCVDHKGFYNNLQTELQPSIAHLKQPIRNFIKIALEIYHLRMQSLKDANIDFNLSTLYFKLKQFQITKTLEAFNDKNLMIELFEKLWSCSYIYYVVMTLINYLSKNSMPFIMLISSILMEENEDEITYFEMIIRNQCLLEDSKMTNNIEFEQIFYTLHGNLQFKNFMQQKYLQNYGRLYRFKQITQSTQDKNIKQIILAFTNYQQIQLITINQAYQAHYKTILLDHIYQIETGENKTLRYVDCMFIQHHTQFISEQFQQQFFNSKFLKVLFNNAEIVYQTLISAMIENPINANQFQSVYHLRLEYPYFKKILFKQLEDQLGDNMTILKTQLLNHQQLKQLCIQNWNVFQIIGIAKSATWEQYNPKYNLEELRFQTIGFLYLKFLQANFAISTLSLILSEVKEKELQINLVRAHYYTISNLMRKKEQFSIEQAYKEFRKLSDVEQVNKQTFFQYQIVKNDNLLEHHMAQFSILLFYYETTDYDRNIYLQKVQEVTGMNEEEIYLQDKAIVEKLIIEYVAIKELINTLPYLNTLYTQFEGGEDTYETLESITLGFIRLFIHIYGQEGLNHIISRVFECRPLNLIFTVSHLLLSLLQSNVDQYNVMRYFYQDQLPQVFQDTINKLARNSFIIKKSQSIINITAYLRSIKAIANKNFSEYIKQTCEYDHLTCELKLRYGLTQLYDPGLYLDCDKLKSEVFESLGEKRNEHINTILGNSVEDEMENYKQLDPIRKSIISTILENSQLEQIIQKSVEQSSYQQNGEQFMFILNYLVRYHQFVKMSPQNEIRDMVIKYQEIFNQGELGTLKQIGQCFKFFLQDLLKNQEAIEERSKIVQKQQQKMQNLKEKFKNKMVQFEQQMTNEESDSQQVVITNQITCYYCKQLIDDQSEACYPALIKLTNIYDYFNFLDNGLQKYLNNELQFTQIQLQFCSHILHIRCAEQSIQNLLAHNLMQNLNWTQKKCITCQFPYNIFFPYVNNKNKQNEEAIKRMCNQFKENVMKFLWQYEKFQKMNEYEITSIFYANIITDFTIKMFQDTDDFINKEKSQYFETIFNTFQYIFAYEHEARQQLLSQKQLIKQDFDVELQLVNLILSNTIQVEQKQLPIPAILSDHELKIQKILGSTMRLPKLNLPQVTITAQEVKSIIMKKIIYQLGEDYNQFYLKHFYKRCSKCNSYPQHIKDQNTYTYEEMYVCLICFEIFCRSACGNVAQSPPFNGNLNVHSEKKHKHDCIYLSIQSGGVALQSNHVILMNQRYLFSDELGVLINPNSPLKQDWNNFKLDMKTLSEIADMIYNQTIRQKIKQYQVNNQFFRPDGSI